MRLLPPLSPWSPSSMRAKSDVFEHGARRDLISFEQIVRSSLTALANGKTGLDLSSKVTTTSTASTLVTSLRARDGPHWERSRYRSNRSNAMITYGACARASGLRASRSTSGAATKDRSGRMTIRSASIGGADPKEWSTSRRSAFVASGATAILRTFGSSALALGVTGGKANAKLGARAKSDPFADVLKDPKFPAKYPFREEDMARYDESSDFIFYSQPRFVTHIDDKAIGALTKYYEREFPPGGENVSVLDVCSSWISHYPKGYKAGKISGVGMNEEELKRNPILTDYAVQDLNEDPKFPYADNTFDVVTNTVSVDYLTRPLEVMQEVRRVLKPGGLAIMSFSNRCFPTKAVSIWTQTGDLDHVWIVGAYYHYAGGFEPPAGEDISPSPGRSDPMYVVTARKSA